MQNTQLYQILPSSPDVLFMASGSPINMSMCLQREIEADAKEHDDAIVRFSFACSGAKTTLHVWGSNNDQVQRVCSGAACTDSHDVLSAGQIR